jgi:hypothetical protein
MEQALEILKRKGLPYAKEAFEGHREQIFAAMQFMCLCSFVARESGLLALDEVAEMWEEESSGEDGGNIALAVSMAKGDMPLKELLLHIIRRIVDASDWDEVEEEILAQAKEKGCSGYEWYVVMIYLSGGKSILEGVEPERLLLMFRVLVPEQWLEDYDRYCHEWTKKEAEKERAEWEERAKKSFEKERSVKTAFNRIFGRMGPEKLRYVIRELDYKTLAAGMAFAEEGVRRRCLENMDERQRGLVKEEWSCNREDTYHLEDILEAMDRMLILAGLMGEAW